MLQKSIFTLILTLTYAASSVAGALSFIDKTIEINGKEVKAKDLVKDIRKITKNENTRYINPVKVEREYNDIPAPNDGVSEICIECQDITNLANQISDIVTKYNIDSPEERVFLRQEAFKLKAIATFMLVVDKEGQTKCLISDTEDHRHRYNTREFEDFELMFTSQADLDAFKSMTIQPKSQTNKIISWFRAEDAFGEDIFIKVVNFKNKDPYFQVYYAGDSFNDPEKSFDSSKIPDISVKEVKKDYSTESAYLRDQEYDTSLGKVKVKKALHVKQDYYIPTELTLIEMETESSLGEDTKLTTETRIDDSKQRVRVNLNSKLTEGTNIQSKLEITPSKQKLDVIVNSKLTELYSLNSKANVTANNQQIDLELDHQGKPVARATATGEGYILAGVTVGSPEFRNFDVETDLSIDTNNVARLSNDFRFQGTTIIKTGTIIREDGRVDLTAKRSFDVFENATVTMEVQHSTRDRGQDLNRTSAYVSFDMKF